ncbi:HlyD family efflux transporter periplasmic adaptor subunit [Microvirga sp. W0021]|uniref:HlyD family efflux transporter periplasmic adaptor subunit n=1 Tax=Hohaiivirga grylli TaxID=3133970 RepID=A0ABV0BL98_9HYPH
MGFKYRSYLMAVTLLSTGLLFSTDYLIASTPAQAQSRLETLINRLRKKDPEAGIAKSNGRIEAQQIDVSAKYAGKLLSVDIEEGDTVEAGQVIARLDDTEYVAQLRGAEAKVQQAKASKAQAEATIAQRESDQSFAKAELDRGEELYKNGHFTGQQLDLRRNNMKVATAALEAAQASQRQAISAIIAAEADVARLKAVVNDMVLVAPRHGRIQYKLARTGEVIGAGQRVATLLDLTDVYLTIFLPAKDAGRLAIGQEARIILDPAPEYVIPAKVSFVAADAQFTPKSVETQEEREKLMFRVKIQIDSGLLKEYEKYVKTGVRGLGYVMVERNADWPTDLAIKLPK